MSRAHGIFRKQIAIASSPGIMVTIWWKKMRWY